MTAYDSDVILVTGGCGFIGGHVVRAAIGRGLRVVNVDKLTYAASPEALADLGPDDGYCHIVADICDAAAMRATFAKHRPAAVLHLAAESHVDRSIDEPAAFLRTNVVGTYTLLEAAEEYCRDLAQTARETFRFVHVSTDEVFGSLGETGVADETVPYAPNSPYAASKASADHFARAWGRTYGLPVIVTNASNNFGPYQFPEKLIPLAIVRALGGKKIGIYGDGLQVRDWLYVEDHAEGLVEVLERAIPGESYNLGGSAERTNIDLVRALCALLDRLRPDSPHVPHADLIAFVDDRPGHDQRYAIDPTKITGSLGWRARTPLGAGLEKTVRWYLDNEAWWQSILERRYDGRRLGHGGGRET